MRDYERVKMKIINLTEHLSLDSILKEASKIKEWTPIDFGKYEGLTIPALVFCDPQYFYWALSIDCFNRQLKLEAHIVADRLQHMKIPWSISVPSVFVIKLKDRSFEDFRIKEGRSGEIKVNSGQVVTSHLDFSLISRPNFATDGARAKMLERVKFHFFDKDADMLRPKDFNGFLATQIILQLHAARNTFPRF